MSSPITIPAATVAFEIESMRMNEPVSLLARYPSTKSARCAVTVTRPISLRASVSAPTSASVSRSFLPWTRSTLTRDVCVVCLMK